MVWVCELSVMHAPIGREWVIKFKTILPLMLKRLWMHEETIIRILLVYSVWLERLVGK